MTFILVAEDDPAVARSLTEALAERSDTETAVVANGALVPDALAARQPDLLVLDVALPGLSGMDVFDIVRSDPAYHGVPILFLTATPDTAQTAFSPVGEHRVIGKPFEVDELLRVVAELTALAGRAEAAA